ncbi:hypothetical protein GGX14DRAFT_564890 [Mycena pura]|uniref:Uncharacterized protein n=1 Tax=Mycena pura TaxID=153505 RepID=A0AAD6VFP9_9AGAR|nr:hypothetical protein GGX14DRAFT_564890 [Mycena pura]
MVSGNWDECKDVREPARAARHDCARILACAARQMTEPDWVLLFAVLLHRWSMSNLSYAGARPWKEWDTRCVARLYAVVDLRGGGRGLVRDAARAARPVCAGWMRASSPCSPRARRCPTHTRHGPHSSQTLRPPSRPLCPPSSLLRAHSTLERLAVLGGGAGDCGYGDSGTPDSAGLATPDPAPPQPAPFFPRLTHLHAPPALACAVLKRIAAAPTPEASKKEKGLFPAALALSRPRAFVLAHNAFAHPADAAAAVRRGGGGGACAAAAARGQGAGRGRAAAPLACAAVPRTLYENEGAGVRAAGGRIGRAGAGDMARGRERYGARRQWRPCVRLASTTPPPPALPIADAPPNLILRTPALIPGGTEPATRPAIYAGSAAPSKPPHSLGDSDSNSGYESPASPNSNFDPSSPFRNPAMDDPSTSGTSASIEDHNAPD